MPVFHEESTPKNVIRLRFHGLSGVDGLRHAGVPSYIGYRVQRPETAIGTGVRATVPARSIVRGSSAVEEPPRDLPFRVPVQCYSGYRGEESPRGFQVGQRNFVVVQILDRWLDPTHRYFKVLASDDRTYILRHDVAGEFWEITHRLSVRS